jgi:peptidoglycan/xylan/chitin deacetylase (PgdA/CDA1 family)
MVCWSVDTEDWKSRDADAVLDIILRQADDGDIILLHDQYPTSVQAALQAVDHLTARGVRFVTVEELFRIKGTEPACGTVYYSARQSRAAEDTASCPDESGE